MNINRELKLIWWAPERCATKLTADIFKNFGFEVLDQKTGIFTPLSETYHSHDIILPEEYKDYSIICNTRNPYDKVLSFYLNYTSTGKNFVYFKNKKDELQEKIDRFTFELFEYAINQKIRINYTMNVPVEKYVRKLHFNDVLPNHIIKMENLMEDFSKLDFITQSKGWQIGRIQEMIEKNDYINERLFRFDELYTMNSAIRVFDYYKKHFYICDYDPFSFTNEELSNEDKIKFLHEI